MDKIVKISQVMSVDTAYLYCSNDELLKIIAYMGDIGIK